MNLMLIKILLLDLFTYNNIFRGKTYYQDYLLLKNNLFEIKGTLKPRNYY